MPYFEIDGSSIYERLYAPKFHLLIFSDGRGSHLKLSDEFENKFGNLIDIHTLPLYPEIVRIFGSDSAFFVVLRPDNYIGLISAGNSVEEIEIYLSRIMGKTKKDSAANAACSDLSVEG
jgi:hypothetical protein